MKWADRVVTGYVTLSLVLSCRGGINDVLPSHRCETQLVGGVHISNRSYICQTIPFAFESITNFLFYLSER